MTVALKSEGTESLTMTRSARVGIVCLVLLCAASASAGTAENRQAALRVSLWLESTQNADGSWGSDPATHVVYTSAVVDGLREQGRRGNSYLRGVTWLENHAAPNLDAHARRTSALLPHGDDVGADRDSLVAGYRPVVGLGSGWGLASVYGASALDTALVLIAFADLGVTPDVATLVQAGLDYLKTNRTPDNGWAIRGSATADPIVTAIVVRALKRHVALYPTLTSYGDEAFARLQQSVGSGSAADQQAHTALALMTWTPGTTSADSLLDALVASQNPAGHWQSSAYVSAVALRAFATRLGNNVPTLQAIVPFADYGLRSAINLSLGRNRGDAIRRAELRAMTSLDARGFGIRDLSSLAELTGLLTLDLRNNAITDVAPLLSMLSLQTVLLQNNPWAGRLCDMNSDNRIDSADVLLATRVARGDIMGAPVEMLLKRTRADVGPTSGPGDGLVDAGDAVVLLGAATGTPTSVCNP